MPKLLSVSLGEVTTLVKAVLLAGSGIYRYCTSVLQRFHLAFNSFISYQIKSKSIYCQNTNTKMYDKKMNNERTTNTTNRSDKGR